MTRPSVPRPPGAAPPADGAEAPAVPYGMAQPRPPRSLRREMVIGYSTLLLVSLALFAGATYLILRQTLARAGTQSLQQTAAAAEQLIVPATVPRVAVQQERVPPGPGDGEPLRRTTRLATGDVVNIYVARTGDVENRAVRSFAMIALVLLPV